MHLQDDTISEDTQDSFQPVLEPLFYHDPKLSGYFALLTRKPGEEARQISYPLKLLPKVIPLVDPKIDANLLIYRDPWLILSALFTPILAILGDGNDRCLCVFYVLLWFLSLCWFFGSMMMIVTTCSEILFTAPRMLYLFYVIIGSGLWCLMRMRHGPAIVVAFGGWWALGVPFAKQFSLVAPIFMASPFSEIPRILPKNTQRCAMLATALVITIFLFFLPPTGKEYLTMAKRVLVSRPSVEDFMEGLYFR